MNFEDPMAEAYAKNDGMDKVVEDNTEKSEDYSEALKDIPNADDKIDSLEETEIDNNPDSLGEAYARDRDEELTTEETVEDNEETEIDNNPDSLGEAYARDRGEVEEDSEAVGAKTENIVEDTGVEDVKNEEIQSFAEIGEEEWVKVSERISTLSEDLVDKGKNAVYTATGILIEAPNIIEGVGIVAGEMADKAYETAYKAYADAVESANRKVREIKANIVEKAENAKNRFFGKIKETGRKFVGKAEELAIKGAALGINAGERVAVAIEEAQKQITNTVDTVRVEAHKASVESSKKKMKKHEIKAGKHAEKLEVKRSNLTDLVKKITVGVEANRHGAEGMNSLLGKSSDVSV